MRLDLSWLGWLHTVACLVALALGAMNLLRRKGDTIHRHAGRWFLGTILVASLISLGIYRTGRFFFPHWLAIATIVCAVLAYGFAHFRWPRRLWLRGHIVTTVLTFYLLIGGGVNEVFLRVNAVRRLSGGFGSPMNAMTHYVLTAITMVVLVWFVVRFSGKRRPGPGSRDNVLETAN